jgi:hypothetical protein
VVSFNQSRYYSTNSSVIQPILVLFYQILFIQSQYYSTHLGIIPPIQVLFYQSQYYSTNPSIIQLTVMSVYINGTKLEPIALRLQYIFHDPAVCPMYNSDEAFQGASTLVPSPALAPCPTPINLDHKLPRPRHCDQGCGEGGRHDQGCTEDETPRYRSWLASYVSLGAVLLARGCFDHGKDDIYGRGLIAGY